MDSGRRDANIAGVSDRVGEQWRVFAALPVDDSVRSLMREIQRQLRPRDWRVRWVDPDLAHLTVRFYGNVAADAVEGMSSRLRHVAGEAAATRVQTGIVGAFPSPARPRVIWVGLEGDVAALSDLASAVARSTSHIGDPDTKAFKPHITLGRLRDGVRPPADFADAVRSLRVEPIAFDIDRLQLIRSVLSPQGPSYTVIGEWVLGSPVSVGPVHAHELHEHG